MAERTEAALSEIKTLGQSPDDNYRTWYEIFVYSFCDSDGNGIGDLNGIRSKLDYLQELGINGIWLMPIHPSTTYHKYNVSDYYSIAYIISRSGILSTVYTNMDPPIFQLFCIKYILAGYSAIA